VPDRDVLQLAADLVAAAQVELVVLHGRVVAEPDGQQEVVEERFTAGDQRGAVRDLDGADGAPLRGEPALPGQPLDEQFLQ
jgi:hypothetical protein